MLKEGTFSLHDDVRVTTKILNHPVIDLGYRIEADGAVFVTVYDHEPFRNLFDGNPGDEDYDEVAKIEGEKAAKMNNTKVQQFIRGADLLIHDAQYTNKEYLASKIGWGHSPIEHVLHSSIKGGVKRLALHHHDPTRTDTELDLIERVVKRRVSQIKSTNMEVFMAREGVEVAL